MKTFDAYFTDDQIITYLCRIRAKQSKTLNRMHLLGAISSRKKFNFHRNSPGAGNPSEDEKLLAEILPPRRMWKKLNKSLRYNNGKKVNSVDANELSLKITINHYKIHNPSETFLLKLNSFIKEIRDEINGHCVIRSPKIIPVKKDDEQVVRCECRPISTFKLKERIIIGLTNKYLSTAFDDSFYEHSYAFRRPKIIHGTLVEVTHHDAIKSIIEFKRNCSCELWVAESDIRKFFDSVHHSVIKKIFNKCVGVLKRNGIVIDERAKRLFINYLKSYAFTKNVIPLNKDKAYWEQFKIDGNFEWIESSLINEKFYKKPLSCRIGVPQGGAISGLIANLVLNEIDRKLKNFIDGKFHYTRFCDDMIVMHSEQDKCREAFESYNKGLRMLKLISHKPIPMPLTKKKYWSPKIKSKAPYRWGKDEDESFKWISFVGYDIDADGNLRVRKKSLNKEKAKQKDVVDEVIEAHRSRRRKNYSYIFESCVNRLIGMSVGRITLKNYKENEPEMCWKNGFVLLSKNKDVSAQMKGLDRSRNHQIVRLQKSFINSSDDDNARIKTTIKENYFTRIRGIELEDSKFIREVLKGFGILESDYSLGFRPSFYLCEELDFNGLNNHKTQILDQLETLFKKRDIPIYGKPFSYYYHIITPKE